MSFRSIIERLTLKQNRKCLYKTGATLVWIPSPPPISNRFCWAFKHNRHSIDLFVLWLPQMLFDKNFSRWIPSHEAIQVGKLLQFHPFRKILYSRQQITIFRHECSFLLVKFASIQIRQMFWHLIYNRSFIQWHLKWMRQYYDYGAFSFEFARHCEYIRKSDIDMENALHTRNIEIDCLHILLDWQECIIV